MPNPLLSEGKRCLQKHEVVKFLDQYHMLHSNQGYQFLIAAIVLTANDESINSGRKVMALYGKLAEHFNTTSSRVERAIRTVIGKTGIKQPNGEFIFQSVDTLLLETPTALVKTFRHGEL